MRACSWWQGREQKICKSGALRALASQFIGRDDGDDCNAQRMDANDGRH